MEALQFSAALSIFPPYFRWSTCSLFWFPVVLNSLATFHYICFIQFCSVLIMLHTRLASPEFTQKLTLPESVKQSGKEHKLPCQVKKKNVKGKNFMKMSRTVVSRQQELSKLSLLPFTTYTMWHQCNSLTRTSKCLCKEVSATKPSIISDVHQPPAQRRGGALPKMEKKESSKYSWLSPLAEH